MVIACSMNDIIVIVKACTSNSCLILAPIINGDGVDTSTCRANSTTKQSPIEVARK